MELNVKYEKPNARISIAGDIDDDGAAILKNKLMELQGKVLKGRGHRFLGGQLHRLHGHRETVFCSTRP